MYCKKCGGKIESYASHCPFCGEALAQNSVQATYTSSNNSVSSEHKSVAQWVGITLVTCIPVIGFVLLCIWAFGAESKSNPTFRNWARSQFVIMVIAVVLSIAFAIISIFLLGSMLESLDPALFQ